MDTGATAVFFGFFSIVTLVVLYVVVMIGIHFLREFEGDPFSLRQLSLVWLAVAVYIAFMIFGFYYTPEYPKTVIEGLIAVLTFAGFIIFMFAGVMTFFVGLFFGAMVFVAFPFYAIARLTKIIPDEDAGKPSYL